MIDHWRSATVLSLVLASLLACKPKAVEAPAGLFHLALQTDWYPQPEMGGFYQAQLQGLYKAAGLDVTLLPGGPFVVGEQMVASGKAEFAMGSSDQVLVADSRGLPLVAVAATMQQDPQAVMVHAESPVKRFEDLEGRTMAVKTGSIWFQYLLKRYNLTRIREVPATYSVATFMQDPDYIQQAFVTSEPYTAEQRGAKVRTIPISSSGYQPYRVIFTSREFIAQHPEIVKKFVDASMQGWKNYLANPSMVNAELQKLNPAMDPRQMEFSIATLKAGHFIDGDGTADSHLGHFTKQRWSTLNQQLADLKVLAKPTDPTEAYSLEFAP